MLKYEKSRVRFLTASCRALGALLLITGCGKKEPQTYVLTGRIVVVNECDGRQISIPADVRVHTILHSDEEPNSSGAADTVRLGPDPAEPAAPKRTGTYRITVAWTDVPGDPVLWERPQVLRGNVPICRAIRCNSGSCRDAATEADIPLTDSVTTYDIRVVCSCPE
jgi:hypothetical protein